MHQARTSSSTPVQTVLFDWGGVIIENPVEGILNHVRQHIPGIAPDAFEGNAMVAFQKGELEELEFWHRAGAPTSMSLESFGGSLWRQAFEHSYEERPEVLHIAQILQQNGIRTAVLSNTEKPSVAMLMDRGYTCFDTYCFSCDWGMVKPEHRIYERCLQTLKVDEASSVLFIDDKSENIAAAQALGIRGHVMTTIAGLNGCLRGHELPCLPGL
ncbi:MAG: HAD family phosphatase [Puniceicoccaceae bacterium]